MSKVVWCQIPPCIIYTGGERESVLTVLTTSPREVEPLGHYSKLGVSSSIFVL